MPYTAPAPLLTAQLHPHLASAGPLATTRRHGRQNSEPAMNSSGSPPPLQRAHSSSSYIYRHRRSLVVSQNTSSSGELGIESKDGRRNSPSPTNTHHAALWKSPSGAMIPTGVVISPPDSKSNSSDDEETTTPGSQRLILADFEAAIMSIDQISLQTPTKKRGPVKPSPKIQRTPSPLDLSLALAAEVKGPRVKAHLEEDDLSIPGLNTPNGVIHAHSSEIATHTPEDSDRGEDEMELALKPSMVRKKSGELVRPALRPKRRPSSAPGTPMFSKAVHFDSQLEHIRHFLQVDKPLAVSAGSSPIETYDGDNEFPFGNSDDRPSQPNLFEWDARIANFPVDQEARKHMPVRLERIFLSPGNKCLVGVVAVANISFQKHVVARFTSDYWKTTSEVIAEYNNDVRRKEANDGYDRFNFSIHLADMGNLETKRMFICIRYNVNGLEFWDNNNTMNYHVDFCKNPKQRNKGTQAGNSPGPRPTSTLPRSRPSDSLASRSRSVPPFPGDFGKSPPSPALPDRRLELEKPPAKPPPCKDDCFLETPIRRSSTASQTFGNRYDFGASLSAAMQPGSVDQTRRGKRSDQAVKYMPESTSTTSITNNAPAVSKPEGGKPARPDEKFEPTAATSPGASSKLSTSSPGPMKPTDIVSGQPYHQSPMYKELVDKYCFYGSSKTGSLSTTHFSRRHHHQSATRNATTPGNNDCVSSYSTITPSSKDKPLSADYKPSTATATATTTTNPDNNNRSTTKHTSLIRSQGGAGLTTTSPSSSTPSNYSTHPPYHHQSMQKTFFSESLTLTFI
ncbi:hypothetical protein GX48_01989 [Paracoccidioides brasiliensis]|nr:hypothetical protein GX48_01989 [Paracoccidioides brasiliensis]